MKRYHFFVLLCFLCVWVLSAPLELSVQYLNGKVEIQRQNKGTWQALKLGARVKEKDRIHTYPSAEAVFAFVNGSQIKLQENSVLDLAEIKDDGQQGNTRLDLRKGNLLFTIKKLSARQQFIFETPTATAAIRGTQGGIGSYYGSTLAYLDEGLLDLTPKLGGQTSRIGPRDLAVQNNLGFVVQPWIGKIPIAEIYQKLIRDTTILKKPVDTLFLKLKSLDTIKGSNATTQNANPASKNIADSTHLIGGTIDPYAVSVYQPQLLLTGKCYGSALAVSIGDFQSKVNSDGTWKIQIYWSQFPLGSHSFPAACLYDRQKADLGLVRVDYSPVVKDYSLDLTTPTSIHVADGHVIIDGHYVGADAVLRLQVGTKIYDLSSPTGNFHQDIEITDRANTWNLKTLQLTLSGPNGYLSNNIDLDIDKTSPRVNTLSPNANAKIDVNQGAIVLNAYGIADDPVTVNILVDGEERSTFNAQTDLISRLIPLVAGVHGYQVLVVDQAGNQTLIDLGSQNYLGRVDFTLNVTVPFGAVKTLKVPPMPPKLSQSLSNETITIQMQGLPNDDPRVIREIVISNPTTSFRRTLSSSEITDVRLDVQVPIALNTNNALSVQVIPINGQVHQWSGNVQINR